MNLTFCGGAKEVTGANYLLESQNKKILIDCGLIQGERSAEEQNFEEFLYDAKEIDAVFITHAHLDHVGRLPLLYKRGFRGRIFTTAPTKALLMIALDDAQEILEEEARKDGHNSLYAQEDVRALENHFEIIEYEETISRGPFSVRFFNAGHILGSAIIEVEAEGKVILFSGDLGNTPSQLFDSPRMFKQADYALMECAYGDRLHKEEIPRKDALENVIEDTAKRGGVLMIPAFALERTQEILYDLNTLIFHGRVPQMPVFIDSPLAIRATKIYQQYPNYYNESVRHELQGGKNLFNFPNLLFTRTVEESKHINEIKPPKIIIAGSGMSQGGRILHHERRYLPDPASTMLFVGYQAEGSMGRRILKGADYVTLFGEKISIRCHIVSIEGYSAHADQQDLVSWARPFKDTVKKVFLVQGEEKSAKALSYQLKDFLGIEAIIPSSGQRVDLE